MKRTKLLPLLLSALLLLSASGCHLLRQLQHLLFRHPRPER